METSWKWHKKGDEKVERSAEKKISSFQSVKMERKERAR